MEFNVALYEKRKKIAQKEKEAVARDKARAEMLNERLESEFNCTLETSKAKRDEYATKLAKIESKLIALEKEMNVYDWD